MKTRLAIRPTITLVLFAALSLPAFAQQPLIQNFRPYDQKGVNMFEPKKDKETPFEGTKVRIGGNFAQQYQSISHENQATSVLYPNSTINRNQLYPISSGFNLATANLNIDVQLADGIRLAVENYMSARHHQEFWVKGGYIQIDKLPMFNNPQWFADKVRVKIGHFQVNYGDQQFRRSDNGFAMVNPFVGNYIMDAFTTEIGGEVYLFPGKGLMLMGGMTNGLIKGDIEEYAATNRTPSIYAKAAFDQQVNDDFRVRISASMYGNSGTTRNTLYAGDRAGSRYYLVMDPYYSSATTKTTTDTKFTSGRMSPNFTQEVTAMQINPFLKYKGVEFFGTLEKSSGKSSAESEKREVTQLAGELVYRFLPNEQMYIGGKYNTLKGQITGADETRIERVEIAAGWFPISNLLLKLEYVNQQYKDFPTNNILHEGKFNGFILEAVVGF